MSIRVLPDLPQRRLGREEATHLHRTNPAVTLCWPIWGFRAEHPPTVIGMLLFTTGLFHVAAFDPGVSRWVSLVQFDDIDIDDPVPIVRSKEQLDAFIFDHYDRGDLIRFDVQIEFE